MPSTAAFEIRGRVDGLPEGSDNIFLPISLSTSAGGLTRTIVLTTVAASATSVACSTATKLVLIIPPSTNTVPWRLAGSQGDVGVQMSSVLPALVPVTTAFMFHAYTTGGTTLAGWRIVEY